MRKEGIDEMALTYVTCLYLWGGGGFQQSLLESVRLITSFKRAHIWHAGGRFQLLYFVFFCLPFRSAWDLSRVGAKVWSRATVSTDFQTEAAFFRTGMWEGTVLSFENSFASLVFRSGQLKTKFCLWVCFFLETQKWWFACLPHH